MHKRGVDGVLLELNLKAKVGTLAHVAQHQIVHTDLPDARFTGLGAIVRHVHDAAIAHVDAIVVLVHMMAC